MIIPGLRPRQDRLHRLGLYPAPGDGEWGPATEAALDRALALLEKAQGLEPPRFPNLPASYRWLLDLSPLPLTTVAALGLLGTKEVPGKAHSPVIMALAEEVGIPRSTYPGDETAWCGLAIAAIAKRAGKDFTLVGNVLGARNWMKFGEPSPEPGLGDILVFWRGSRDGWQGHVGTYIAEDAAAYHVAGGNQSNAFNIMRLAKDRLLGARRPVYRNPPSTVRPYRVAAAGALSRNEA